MDDEKHRRRCTSRELFTDGPTPRTEQCILRAGHAHAALHVGVSGLHWEGRAYSGVAATRHGASVTIDARLANLEGAPWRRG